MVEENVEIFCDPRCTIPKPAKYNKEVGENIYIIQNSNNGEHMSKKSRLRIKERLTHSNNPNFPKASSGL